MYILIQPSHYPVKNVVTRQISTTTPYKNDIDLVETLLPCSREIKSIVNSANQHRPPLKPAITYDGQTCARAYLLTGRSIAPFEQDVEAVKYGYVRLSIWEATTDDGEFGIDLHFGKGTWEGGYIDFVGDEVTELLKALATIEDGAQEITGQGKVIDGDSFDPQNDMKSKLAPKYGGEETMSASLEPIATSENSGVVITLGDHERAGVKVEATYSQRMDLLQSIKILRDKSRDDLPGNYTSYPRIGPEGKNTWNMGRDPEFNN